MNKYTYTYTVANKFCCFGESMLTVIIMNKAACVMLKKDYNRIIKKERKFKKRKRLKVA